MPPVGDGARVAEPLSVMELNELLSQAPLWLGLPLNLLVCAVAAQYYFNYRRVSVLLIALSAGLGAAVSGLVWSGTTIVPVAVVNLIVVVDFTLWAIGICMLLREFAAHEKRGG